MSEEDVRGGLQDAVSGEPPLSFDPDELMVAARKQATRRRALFAAGVTTVAVAVAAVAVPVALGRVTGSANVPAAAERTAPTAITTTTTRPPQWPPSDAKPVEYTNEELRAQGIAMRKHLLAAVPAVLPGATDFEFGEFGGEAEGQFYEGQDSVNTHISFTLDGGRYSLVVEVRAPGAEVSKCAEGGEDCHDLGEKDGGALKSAKVDVGDGTILTVRHYRRNGALVSISAYSYDMASRTTPIYLPTIPVTLEQLMALATDPDLGL